MKTKTAVATTKKQPKTFVLSADNDVCVYPSRADIPADSTDVFETEAQLRKLAAKWPFKRLMEIYNSLPGVTPVKKFATRPLGVKRIFAQIDKMEIPAPAPEPAAKETASKRAKVNGSAEVGSGGKKALVLEMLKREGGAKLGDIMTATGWQKHTVRGFIAGTCNTKMGLGVRSEKVAGERVYSI